LYRAVLLGGPETEQDLQDADQQAKPPGGVDLPDADGGDDVERAKRAISGQVADLEFKIRKFLTAAHQLNFERFSAKADLLAAQLIDLDSC
jgi:hypothetical protein